MKRRWPGGEERGSLPEAPRPLIPDLTRNAWVATFHGDEAMARTLGSDTVLTRFTLHVGGQEAGEEVQHLNPQARVRLANPAHHGGSLGTDDGDR